MESIQGLSAQEFKIVLEVLSREPLLERAYVFGSRAKGNYKVNSDVDLALVG
jgi:predicted nucleotidyltransferase